MHLSYGVFANKNLAYKTREYGRTFNKSKSFSSGCLLEKMVDYFCCSPMEPGLKSISIATGTPHD